MLKSFMLQGWPGPTVGGEHRKVVFGIDLPIGLGEPVDPFALPAFDRLPRSWIQLKHFWYSGAYEAVGM